MLRYKILYIYLLLQSFTIQRIWNVIKLKTSFFLSTVFKVHLLWGMPSYISIEPTNICNLLCPECPTGNESSIVEKGKMDVQTFQRVIEQTKKNTMYINLFFQGEPFVNSHALEMIKIARDANIVVGTSSNAHYITSKNAKDIVDSGLSKIIISLDGHNQETYEIYRKNGDFSKVMRGLRALQEAKKDRNSNTPLVELQCLLLKHTEHEKEKIKDIGKTYNVDAVIFKTAQFYSVENLHMVPEEKNSRYTLNTDTGTLERKNPPKNKCWRMWSSSVFAWNGNVVPCCFDKDHTYSYGNIMDTPLNNILNSNQTKRFKTTVHTNRQKIKMCQNCTS